MFFTMSHKINKGVCINVFGNTVLQLVNQIQSEGKKHINVICSVMIYKYTLVGVIQKLKVDTC